MDTQQRIALIFVTQGVGMCDWGMCDWGINDVNGLCVAYKELPLGFFPVFLSLVVSMVAPLNLFITSVGYI